MGYRHIDNLYKDQTILLFRECYALEKIHGTSAHITWKHGQLHLHPGGETHSNFVTCFDFPALEARFREKWPDDGEVTVYGEAYGGSCQKQTWRYGPTLKFVAFEVCIRDTAEHWLAVRNAHGLVESLGLEFVHYKKISTDLEAIDAERDADSEQAIRNGVGPGIRREGVVLRPLAEFRDPRGERVMAKHKRDEERETASPRVVADPAKLEVLDKAAAIAMEWVTETRLDHVLDKMPAEKRADTKFTKDVIAAMVEDVEREAAGEIVASREARTAIGKRTAKLFLERCKARLRECAQ